MRRFFKNWILRFRRRQEGVAAVEFAICLIPLMLLVGGIIDYGQLWYMESTLATASREGARYATRYQTGPSGRLAPDALSPTVQAYVTSNYGKFFSSDENFQVALGGDSASSTAGDPVTVTVTAQKHWFFLGILPGLTDPQQLSSTTEMSLE
jgi:Flp pilus assembly protein TadG